MKKFSVFTRVLTTQNERKISTQNRATLALDQHYPAVNVGNKFDKPYCSNQHMNHQQFQVPKMEVLNLVRLFLGGFPLTWALQTAYMGEYLHFRYLKCLVMKVSLWEYRSLCKLRSACLMLAKKNKQYKHILPNGVLFLSLWLSILHSKTSPT